MQEYIMLFHFTQKGVENIKDSPNRISAVKKLFESSGAKIKLIYAVLGRFDVVFLVEAPSDETIAKISLQVSALGYVHAETLRAFNETQYKTIINELA